MTSEERLKICEKCGLLKKDSTWGPVCDSAKGMSKETGEVSVFPRSGGVRGCGCRLRYRTKDPAAHCVAKKG